jgi:cytochrome c oxidase subunit I
MSAVPLIPEPTTALPHVPDDEGLLHWIASTDHKVIGLMYIFSAFAFFCIGGIEALLMRWQLSQPRNTLLSPSAYNQLFTMHGTTMIFLVIMPMLLGFAIYFVPLQIGANDMAFPRLNALGYWAFIFGGLLLYYSILAGGAPDKGWFAYAPMTEAPYSPDYGMDFYAVGLLTAGIGTIGTAINLIVTIVTMRAPGMSIRRVPLFVWMTLINNFLIIFAFQAFNADLVMLLIDRHLGGNFFSSVRGGQPVLWQHVFWSFGHPEVYIMVLPAWGIISEVIPVFSRKPIFSYSFVAGSTVAIWFLSMSVWGHHMFTVGMGHPLDILFSLTSFMIAVPTGIKIFSWLATMWHGKLIFTTSMLFASAFIPMFTLGGVTGVSFAAFPVDWQVEDSYYVVAHLHYVLAAGSLFALFAGFYYWWPKMTGRMLSEKLGRWNFWTMFIGFNVTFFPQHLLGMMGMPRRVYTYPDLPGWAALNLLSSLGSAVIGVSVLFFIWNMLTSMRTGAKASDNPWEAWSLEWATTSPPAVKNFDLVPPVRGRRPLWDLVHRASDPAESGQARRYGREEVPPVSKYKLGIGIFIMSETTFFATLILAYAFYRVSPANVGGPTPGVLDVKTTGFFSFALWASSATVWLAGRAVKKGRQTQAWLWFALTIALGATFIFGEGKEWTDFFAKGIVASKDVWATSFFTLTGFHGLHVMIGLLLLTILMILTATGKFRRHPEAMGVEVISWYWHFVDVMWVAIYSVVYLWSIAPSQVPHF